MRQNSNDEWNEAHLIGLGMKDAATYKRGCRYMGSGSKRAELPSCGTPSLLIDYNPLYSLDRMGGNVGAAIASLATRT